WADERELMNAPPLLWKPVVTFWQVSGAAVFATDVPSGHGHRYGLELADAWAALLPRSRADRAARRSRQVMGRPPAPRYAHRYAHPCAHPCAGRGPRSPGVELDHPGPVADHRDLRPAWQADQPGPQVRPVHLQVRWGALGVLAGRGGHERGHGPATFGHLQPLAGADPVRRDVHFG